MNPIDFSTEDRWDDEESFVSIADPVQTLPGATSTPASIRVSVAVVESDPPTRDALLRQLGEGVTPFSSIEELAGRLTGAVPVVVVS